MVIIVIHFAFKMSSFEGYGKKRNLLIANRNTKLDNVTFNKLMYGLHNGF